MISSPGRGHPRIISILFSKQIVPMEITHTIVVATSEFNGIWLNLGTLEESTMGVG